MRQFMTQIPDSIIEAARIDGAGEYRTFWQIIMPNVKSAWLTLAIFQVQALWNTPATTYIYREELKTMPYAMSQIVAGGVIRMGAAAATNVIMMIVPITFFIVSQSKIIETMATSGMKE
jgi:ABC-type glycerol-3-phosphate transport system permease component